MLTERLSMAQQYLDDARYLLAAECFASAVSRAYYAAYQAMWAALEDPPAGGRWRHLGMISHCVRGYWCASAHPHTGPGLLEPFRFPLRRLYQLRIDADYNHMPLDAVRAGECIETVTRTIAEIEQRSRGENP